MNELTTIKAHISYILTMSNRYMEAMYERDYQARNFPYGVKADRDRVVAVNNLSLTSFLTVEDMMDTIKDMEGIIEVTINGGSYVRYSVSEAWDTEELHAKIRDMVKTYAEDWLKVTASA